MSSFTGVLIDEDFDEHDTGSYQVFVDGFGFDCRAVWKDLRASRAGEEKRQKEEKTKSFHYGNFWSIFLRVCRLALWPRDRLEGTSRV